MENDSQGSEDQVIDTRSRLDKTIDRIGMGPYQWTLVSLCGFGWLADNCWIQTVAIILPRVQQHYDIPDRQIGSLSSSLFLGMMLGAMGWGACSDLMGRIAAFNATLFFTALFGIVAGFAPSFLLLCVILFCLGSAVGGSMPTDGTLLLEHMPNGKQYLLTALSVFFSFGSVLSALVGLSVIPSHSCHVNDNSPCLPEQNMGWKYMLSVLGLLTLFMFLARVVFFRLYESPRYLVHAGRPEDAVMSLQKITQFNGKSLTISLADVEDTPTDPSSVSVLPEGETQAATSTTDTPLRSSAIPQHDYITIPSNNHPSGSYYPNPDEERESDPFLDNTDRKHSASILTISSPVLWGCFEARLPKWISRPLNGWLIRMQLVLSGEWRRTTLLIWFIWFAISLAFTMFNVFLPKLLETTRTANQKQADLTETMWDIVIFTLAGCPGAIIGAYLVRSRLGRQHSLALSTLLTAALCVIFATVEGRWLTRLSTIGISLSSSTMWAVLYGMTPEIFATKVRGTACGTASALSRVGGMLAPLIGGILLGIDRTIPVYASVAIFIAAGLSVFMLRIQHWNSTENSIMH